MGVCNCSIFCCTLLYVHSSIAIILKGKRELIALLNLSSWCLVMVERYHRVVCSLLLWYFLIILTYYFCNHLSWLLCFYCLTDAFYCKCSVAIPHSAMGSSAVCVMVVFPDHTHLFLRIVLFSKISNGFLY